MKELIDLSVSPIDMQDMPDEFWVVRAQKGVWGHPTYRMRFAFILESDALKAMIYTQSKHGRLGTDGVRLGDATTERTTFDRMRAKFGGRDIGVLYVNDNMESVAPRYWA